MNDHVLGCRAQPGHLGVVAHLKIEGVRGRSVSAGFEQQRIPLRPELIGDLLVSHCVDAVLN